MPTKPDEEHKVQAINHASELANKPQQYQTNRKRQHPLTPISPWSLNGKQSASEKASKRANQTQTTTITKRKKHDPLTRYVPGAGKDGKEQARTHSKHRHRKATLRTVDPFRESRPFATTRKEVTDGSDKR